MKKYVKVYEAKKKPDTYYMEIKVKNWKQDLDAVIDFMDDERYDERVHEYLDDLVKDMRSISKRLKKDL